MSGPPGLRLIKGFRDEAFAGEWKKATVCRDSETTGE